MGWMVFIKNKFKFLVSKFGEICQKWSKWN